MHLNCIIPRAEPLALRGFSNAIIPNAIIRKLLMVGGEGKGKNIARGMLTMLG